MQNLSEMTPEERGRFYMEFVSPRILEISLRFVDATGMEDEVLEAAAHAELVEFYEELTNRGYWYPSLTEALADHCPDGRQAIGYYQKALEQARALSEPTHTILLWMAMRLHELGQLEQAEACLAESRVGARQAKDEDSLRHARQLESDWLKKK